MKYDPYDHKGKYLDWKSKVSEKGIPEVGKENSDLILRYLNDMEKGLNVANRSTKGPRGFNTLNKMRQRMCYTAVKFRELYGINIVTDIDDDKLVSFFVDMKAGVISRIDGGSYRSVDTYAKIFKAFWHWWMKINRKNKIEIRDITCDLDTRQEKPDWVYLTDTEVRLLADNAKHYYRALIYFLYDSGIRSPTELMNIKVSDFYSDYKELNIRDEISKTFGRRIKLMSSSQIMKDYVLINKLGMDDFLFTKTPSSVNAYLKNLSKRILGDKASPAGQKYSDLTMYDFRHCSCCYWLPRYKSESALMYRFGWKKSDKIHYYSELLGMKDTITKADLEMEKPNKFEPQNKDDEKDMLKARLALMEQQMRQLMEMANR